MNPKILNIIHWTSRVGGSLFLTLIIINFFEDGIPRFSTLSTEESLITIALYLMCIGVILEFKWTLVGALIIIATYLMIVIVKGTLFVGPVFPLVFLFGLMHLYYWIMKGKAKTGAEAKEKA